MAAMRTSKHAYVQSSCHCIDPAEEERMLAPRQCGNPRCHAPVASNTNPCSNPCVKKLPLRSPPRTRAMQQQYHSSHCWKQVPIKVSGSCSRCLPGADFNLVAWPCNCSARACWVRWCVSSHHHASGDAVTWSEYHVACVALCTSLEKAVFCATKNEIFGRISAKPILSRSRL